MCVAAFIVAFVDLSKHSKHVAYSRLTPICGEGQRSSFSASGQVFNHPFFDTTSVRKRKKIISRLQVAKVRFLLVCS